MQQVLHQVLHKFYKLCTRVEQSAKVTAQVLFHGLGVTAHAAWLLISISAVSCKFSRLYLSMSAAMDVFLGLSQCTCPSQEVGATGVVSPCTPDVFLAFCFSLCILRRVFRCLPSWATSPCVPIDSNNGWTKFYMWHYLAKCSHDVLHVTFWFQCTHDAF